MRCLLLLLALVGCASATALQKTIRSTFGSLRGRKAPPLIAGTCQADTCKPGYVCEERPCTCTTCVPEAITCKTFKCLPYQKCQDRPTGPVCIPLTCGDIQCAADELCNELPDGPDCVPDVPSCIGFYCRRGTNCHIRYGSPICLPNTCFVRQCTHNLTCIDTPHGALCRKGKKRRGCEGRYCPLNSVCTEDGPHGPTCVHI